MGIVYENTNFHAVILIFCGTKKIVPGKKIWGYKKKKKKNKKRISTIFSSAPNTLGHSERIHTWLSPVSVAVIVNTAAGCYF